MSADITDSDRISWQRQAAVLLGRILELAVKEGLPVINWTVAKTAGIHGEVLSSGPPAARRADLAAWRGAITLVSGLDPDDDHEHNFPDGEARLITNWRQIPVTLAPKKGVYPGVHVTLTASIWPEEEEYGGD